MPICYFLCCHFNAKLPTKFGKLQRSQDSVLNNHCNKTSLIHPDLCMVIIIVTIEKVISSLEGVVNICLILREDVTLVPTIPVGPF